MDEKESAIYVRLPEDLVQRLKMYCAHRLGVEHGKQKYVIRDALEYYLNKEESMDVARGNAKNTHDQS